MNLFTFLVVALPCLWVGYQLRRAVDEFEQARAEPQQAAELQALRATQYLSAEAWLARQAMYEVVEETDEEVGRDE